MELFLFLAPRIGSPSNDTRAVVVAARDRTLRFDAVARFVVARETTLRVDVVRAGLVFLAETLRVASPRDAFAAVAVAVVGRADVAPLRGFVRPDVRGDVAPCAAPDSFSNTGPIGSAKTTRIDNNVEHTKNAPINNKTVPSAFLQKFPTERFFIYTLLYPGISPEIQYIAGAIRIQTAPHVYCIITFLVGSVKELSDIKREKNGGNRHRFRNPHFFICVGI